MGLWVYGVLLLIPTNLVDLASTYLRKIPRYFGRVRSTLREIGPGNSDANPPRSPSQEEHKYQLT